MGALTAAAQPFTPQSCAADRGISNLNCTANDIEIASVTVNNAVTTCRAGDPVTLNLSVNLHVNASDRHDVGIFLARDGLQPVLPAGSGGSANCAVFGIPQSPAPFADIDGNACGDFLRGGLPQGTVASVTVPSVTVTCLAGPTGNLVIPSVVTWDTAGTPTSCQAPVEQWLRPGSPAKCRAGITADIPVVVQGKISITKQTTPDASTGSFSFTATGAGVTPAAFALADNQTQVLTTGNLTSAGQTYTVTEAALAGFDPTAQIVCVDKDGDARPDFVTLNPATRTLSVQMSANGTAGLPELYCTYTNTRQGSITIVKNTVGGNGTFAFTGSQNFSITTAAGTGQNVLGGLAPGSYTVSETVPAGWDLANLACSDPSGGTTTSGATATIGLAAGENVTCTFTDAARGQIQVSKATVGGNGTFSFNGPENFSITTNGGAGGPFTLSNLPAATYSVSEAVPAGWDLTGISCTDPSGGTTTSGSTASIALAAGETVACTFTDTRRASIVVAKATTGGDATFSFTGSQAFSITTTSGSGQNATAFASVVPSTPYTIVEAVPAGWSLQGATCRDATTSAPLGSALANGVSVTPAPGQSVICTFNDVKLATLRIYKHTQPHIAQAFGFTSSVPGGAVFNLSDDGINPNFITFANIAPSAGGYTVTEAAVPGYVLTSLTCSDMSDPDPTRRSTVNLATRTITPHLDAGETLECTFTNTQIQAGSITVTKHAIGGDGAFPYANSGGVGGSLTNPAAFNIVTSGANHVGAQQLTLLAAGTYTITETVPAGWDMQPPVECVVTSGSNTTFTQVANGVTIALGTTGLAVDAVACEFHDVKRGSITIVKSSSPPDPQAFTFGTTSSPATTPLTASFTLADSGAPPNSRVFANLVAAVYTVTEAPAANWQLNDISCSGGANVTTNPASGLATIALQPGEDVTCTYANAKSGTISITKNAVGGAGGETFTFSGALSGAIASGQALSGTFPAGTYSIQETVAPGWDLSNIACAGATVAITGGSGATPGFEPGDTTVDVTLANAQSASCTFTNTRRGSIRIVKQSGGGDGAFSFAGARPFQIVTSGGTGTDVATYASVAPGTYAVTEVVPNGWRLTGLTCSNASAVNLATATASVTVAAGEQVTCTFVDTRNGTITITKRISGDSPMTATFSVPASLDPAGTFTLAPPIDTQMASRLFVDVAPGIYPVTELAPPAGWVNSGITCTDPSGNTSVNTVSRTASINLAAGEGVQCVYDNVSLATITIRAVSSGGTGSFGFAASSLGATSFSLATIAEGVPAGRTFTGVMPGTYPVDGLGSTGWQLYEVICLSEGGETYWTIAGARTTIVIPHGEEITCTYYYRPGFTPPPPPPAVEGIPTLSEWGMIILATLMLLAAGSGLRRRARAPAPGSRD